MSGAFAALGQRETLWMAAIFAVTAMVLARARPHERTVYLHTSLIFVLGLSAQAVSGALTDAELAKASDVLGALGEILAAVAVIRIVGIALFRWALPAVRLPVPRIIEDILITAGYLAYGLVRLRYAGLDFSGIVTTSAIMTAVVAFALQDTLGNVLGGLALQLDSSIKVGDWIRVEDVSGRVTDIRWRSTSIETTDWETVVVPNGLLMKSKFRVIGQRAGQPSRWRRWIRFAVDPKVAPTRVVAIAEGALAGTSIPHLAADAPVSCVLEGFNEGNLQYALRYYLLDPAEDAPTDGAVRTHIYTAFQREDIRISEPSQTVHLVQEDERHEQRVEQRGIERRTHALEGVELFASLTDEERRRLAARLKYAPFASGDTVTRQGNVSHWLYVLISGEIELQREVDGGAKVSLGMLHAGQFFGEMGLLTGAPRTATAIARTDVECYRLDAASFKDLLTSRPGMADEISHVMAERQAGLAAAAQAAGHTPPPPEGRAALLARIRTFFGLA